MTTSAQNPIRFVNIEAHDITKGFLEASFPNDQSVYVARLNGQDICIITLRLYAELVRGAVKSPGEGREGSFFLKDNDDWNKFLDHVVVDWEKSGSPDPFSSLELPIVSFVDFLSDVSGDQTSIPCRLKDGVHEEKVAIPKVDFFRVIKGAFDQ